MTEDQMAEIRDSLDNAGFDSQDIFDILAILDKVLGDKP